MNGYAGSLPARKPKHEEYASRKRSPKCEAACAGRVAGPVARIAKSRQEIPITTLQKKSMHPFWFVRWGLLYRPASTAGWILTFASFLFLIYIFFIIDRDSHSASDTIIGVFPWGCIVIALLGWIAANMSEKKV